MKNKYKKEKIFSSLYQNKTKKKRERKKEKVFILLNQNIRNMSYRLEIKHKKQKYSTREKDLKWHTPAKKKPSVTQFRASISPIT